MGAAVNAEEIQVWKDVDGMLTWNPKVKAGGYRLKSLSYEEAAELAQAGATILHPETIAPAQRLRIPVIIRNTFRPDAEGTRIDTGKVGCRNPVKSIACKTNVTVIELRSPSAGETLAEYFPVIERVCGEHKTATLLGMSEEVIYLELESNGREPHFNVPREKCLEVHVRTDQAIITLVGQGLKRCNVVARLAALLNQQLALVLPQAGESRLGHEAIPVVASADQKSLHDGNPGQRAAARCRRPARAQEYRGLLLDSLPEGRPRFRISLVSVLRRAIQM